MGSGSDDLELAFDSATGRPILVAPKRRHRPLLTSNRTAETCPFCIGEERQTPPEVDAVRAAGTRADQPGWRVRAFDNLYPAAPCHEVIVEGADHETRPCRVPVAVWREALPVYRRRIAAMEANDDVTCAFLFKNVGREAGASIEHNHSQLIGLPMLPPRLELELAQDARQGQCVVCAQLATAHADQRLVFEGEHHLAFCPARPKLPLELWIAPRDHGSDFLDATADQSADLAQVFSNMLHAIENAKHSPLNLYLHRVPAQAGGGDFHWHFEIQPRTGFLAGLELGGDMYINSISGAEGAATLRAGLADHDG